MALTVAFAALAGCGGSAGGGGPGGTTYCTSPRPFAVPTGAFQWTPITASADTRRVFLSSSSGDDDNDCLSDTTACETVARAVSLLRDGYPDHLLIRRGDTFDGPLATAWSLSGRSASEPMVIATYGTSGGRPYFRTGDRGAFRTYDHVPLRHLRIMDLRFHANERDPADPSYTAPTPASEPPSGIWMTSRYGIEDILIEGCEVSHFNGGLVAQAPAAGRFVNLRLRANHIHDVYSVMHDANGDGDTDDPEDIHQGHSGGAYTEWIDGMLLEQNVFDHNGGLITYPGDPRGVVLPGFLPRDTAVTWFNHQVYSDGHNCNVVAVGNVFANGDGLQLRSGGIARDNVFVRTINALTGGNDDFLDLSGGFTFEVQNNLFLEGTDFPPESVHAGPRANGIQFTNVSAAGARITDNLFLRDVSAAPYGRAIELRGGNTLGSGEIAVVRAAEVARNTIVNWRGGIVLRGAPASAFRSTTVHDNVVQNPLDTEAWVAAMQGAGGGNVVWAGNTYQLGRARGDWFDRTGGESGIGVDFAAWSALAGEAGSVQRALTIANPGVRLQEVVVGPGAAYEEIWPLLRAQTRWSWNPSLETRNVIAGVRTALGVQR